MNITHNHFSDRAQRTITEIDQKAAKAARMCKSNPEAAIMFLGELRGKIEGLRTDVRVVAAERDAMERVAREAMDLPPHTDKDFAIPVTTPEKLKGKDELAREYEERRRYDEQFAVWE